MKVRFDEDTIRRLSSELVSALDRLRELAVLPQDAFLADPHKIASAKYNCILAIGAGGGYGQPFDKQKPLAHS